MITLLFKLFTNIKMYLFKTKQRTKQIYSHSLNDKFKMSESKASDPTQVWMAF